MTADRSADAMLTLTRALCGFRTGVVADGNEALFSRLQDELPFTLHRYAAGQVHLGWEIPRRWRVQEALLLRDGKVVHDAATHPLGVGMYSRSFEGPIELDDLKPHLVSNPALPDAILYHCNWLYRPWDADWALSIPHRIVESLQPGRYEVRLRTSYDDGEMIVGVHEHRGTSDRTVVFQAHHCHPGMANDGFAGIAALIRLFQGLRGRTTRFTYRLVLAPEHIGSVFYLRDRSRDELERIVGGVFAEIPSTGGPIVVSPSLSGELAGGHPLDTALLHAARRHPRGFRTTHFRGGIGNDETVWEAPGYEVPFAQLSSSLGQPHHYPEYHTSLDTPDRIVPEDLVAFLEVLERFVEILERDAVYERTFDGYPSLSSPAYRLYRERFDPAESGKKIDDDPVAWGRLSDAIYRLFDGRTTTLAIAERYGLPFHELRDYLARFEEKGLVVASPAPFPRAPISRRRAEEAGR